jgi:peptide-methionine (S)-S-oxide reductase
MNEENTHTEQATLGGGCFWCLEPIYQDLQGVIDAEVGYSGGDKPEPSYEQVCTGRTGHAEVVRVTFDPQVISYEEILKIFFTFHNPTTLNRQGADVGTQYRSVIFYHSPEQKGTADRVIQEIEEQGLWDDPIVTQVEPLENYYRGIPPGVLPNQPRRRLLPRGDRTQSAQVPPQIRR